MNGNGNGQSDWWYFGKLELRFWMFHHKRPIVADLLEGAALARFRAGHKHGSIQKLYEEIREYLPLPLEGDGIKLNNNHTAFYARLLEERNPELKGFFRKRRQRIQCSFGPKNEDLPPGDHIA